MKGMIKRRQRAFTLLELLVVVAILAIIGGGLLVAYEGLEEDASEGQDSFNIGGVNRAVRTFRVLNSTFPDELDSLLAGDASAAVFTGALLDRLDDDLAGRLLATATLSAGELAALNAIGITTVRDIDTDAGGTNPYDNDNDFTDDSVTVPNRIFDDQQAAPSGFYGVARTLAAADEVATVSVGSTLGTLLGLVAGDEVVAIGLGNNTSMANAAYNGALGEVPYSRVGVGEYGRYILLLQVSDAGGAFSEARFLGVLDAKGKLLDEAYADFAD
jgi:prepilin-type N-terminal cleavage/methylation domain-containing protein